MLPPLRTQQEHITYASLKMGLQELKQVKWADMEEEENCESLESSDPSFSSSLSEDLEDDAESSSSSSPSSRGPLFEFADLMAQLPIKRGLSKFYDGKSQSFASLASVGSVEDLAKFGKRMKSCKSFGSNLHRGRFGPKPTIAKRSSPKRSLSFSPSSPAKGTMAVI